MYLVKFHNLTVQNNITIYLFDIIDFYIFNITGLNHNKEIAKHLTV